MYPNEHTHSASQHAPLLRLFGSRHRRAEPARLSWKGPSWAGTVLSGLAWPALAAASQDELPLPPPRRPARGQARADLLRSHPPRPDELAELGRDRDRGRRPGRSGADRHRARAGRQPGGFPGEVPAGRRREGRQGDQGTRRPQGRRRASGLRGRGRDRRHRDAGQARDLLPPPSLGAGLALVRDRQPALSSASTPTIRRWRRSTPATWWWTAWTS